MKHQSGERTVIDLRLRECGRKMEEKHFLDHNDEHVEFLPVEWRSKLQLDGG